MKKKKEKKWTKMIPINELLEKFSQDLEYIKSKTFSMADEYEKGYLTGHIDRLKSLLEYMKSI